MITICDFINLLYCSHEYTFGLAVEDEDNAFINEMTAEGACALFGNETLINFSVETDTHILLTIAAQRNLPGRKILHP